MKNRKTRRRRARRVAFVALPLIAIGAVVGIFLAARKPPAPLCTVFAPSIVGKKHFDAPPCPLLDENKIYIAHLQTSLGPITITLDPILAPQTVNNFVFLARAKFFDGQLFHRIENAPDHALVQTGDPSGTGRGGPGYTYRGEVPSPITQYNRGTVAMANRNTPVSNGSQFFIVVRDYRALSAPQSTPNYTFFGFVNDSDSLRTLDEMLAVPLDGTRPLTPIVLQRVTIEESDRFPAQP